MFKFFRKCNKNVLEPSVTVQKLTPEQTSILDIFDYAAADFIFPMLDNGYYYLAASRLSLYRDETVWALVFEVFGFSPRAGMPDICVTTMSNKPYNRMAQENYVSEEAYSSYLRKHPNTEQRTFFPIENDAWRDADDCEIVSVDDNDRPNGDLILRGRSIELSALSEFRKMEFRESGEKLFVFELCRYLASEYPQDVLASPEEGCINIAPNMKRILVLDDWYHPDLADGVKPSESETFRQIASVLATGDLSLYVPTAKGNTHWKNWPEGGAL